MERPALNRCIGEQMGFPILSDHTQILTYLYYQRIFTTKRKILPKMHKGDMYIVIFQDFRHPLPPYPNYYYVQRSLNLHYLLSQATAGRFSSFNLPFRGVCIIGAERMAEAGKQRERGNRVQPSGLDLISVEKNHLISIAINLDCINTSLSYLLEVAQSNNMCCTMSNLSTHSSICMKATGSVAKAKRDMKKIPLDQNHA